MMFSFNTNRTLALNYEDYINGTWRNDNHSEFDLYETVSPQIFHLVKRVLIRNLTSPFSDAYEVITYEIEKNINYKTLGIEFIRKDYYVTFKTYCLTLKYSDFGFDRSLRCQDLVCPSGISCSRGF